MKASLVGEIDKEVAEFLRGKSDHALSLFWHFVACYQKIGNVSIQATKSMIAFSARTRFAYVIRFGKSNIDIVFPFNQPYPDNLCFHKIAQVPGSQQYNHHLRMLDKADINEEVFRFMRLAFDQKS